MSTSCEFYDDDVTVTWFLTLDMVTLLLKVSVRNSVLLFGFFGQKDLVQMHT